jgi:dUTP pyrophosphatase
VIKEKRYCDRCGEEIERGDILPIKTSNLSLRKKRWTCAVSSLAGRSYYSNVELCCSCEKSLKAWFKNKQKNGVFESLDDESLKIKIKYQDGVKPLEKTAKGDLIDLAASETVIMRKGDYRMIPLGVAMELPPGHFAKVYPRSSTYKKHGIIMANSVGIVDNTYKGDADIWQFPAVALRDTCIVQGTRIAQFEICKAQVPIEFEAVEKLGNPGRGGFGSTGD